jgi:hypothetical protein
MSAVSDRIAPTPTDLRHALSVSILRLLDDEWSPGPSERAIRDAN